jgi:hypothetical protein
MDQFFPQSSENTIRCGVFAAAGQNLLQFAHSPSVPFATIVTAPKSRPKPT